jgi:hypothetical protein
MIDTKTIDLLRRAAYLLQEYHTELYGDLNSSLAMEIEAYLDTNPQDHWSKLKDLAGMHDNGGKTL